MTFEERRLVKALVDRSKRERLVREAQAEGMLPRTRPDALPTSHPGVRYLRGCECPRCSRTRKRSLERARTLRPKVVA